MHGGNACHIEQGENNEIIGYQNSRSFLYQFSNLLTSKVGLHFFKDAGAEDPWLH